MFYKFSSNLKCISWLWWCNTNPFYCWFRVSTNHYAVMCNYFPIFKWSVSPMYLGVWSSFRAFCNTKGQSSLFCIFPTAVMLNIFANSNILSYLFCSIHINEVVFRSLSLSAIRKVIWLTVTTYLCQKWPCICNVCQGHNPVLISSMITHIDNTFSLFLLFITDYTHRT